MKLLKCLLFTLFSLLAVNNDAIPCSLIPDNKMEIPTNSGTGVSKEEFEELIKEFIKVNGPLAREKGYNLVIKNLWDDKTVNANTTRSGNKWIINAFGGLARYNGVDADTYVLVLCHELGHQIGGYPKSGWVSFEGQSDYYATSKCYRRMSYSRKVSFEVPLIVEQYCSILHRSREEILMCINGSLVGEKLANVLNSMSRGAKAISFNTPDKTQVSETDESHPKPQCRLDTYFAGSVCGEPYNVDFSDREAITGACVEEKGHIVGTRPRCWYKPNL